ncbi:MAG TPA: response regulator transcription factor [Dehalococcoidia bacterium]|nr:response regulator transcription factor [Dehalococcoidia bacterium]
MAHLLVVEDEARLARLIKRVLEEEGHVVDLAHDGDTAQELGQAPGFDAIVLDVLLPGRNGFDVCRELRAAGVQTPVLMLTARGAVEDRVVGLDAGADDYLTKPFAFEELLARIRALTRRPPAIVPGAGSLSVGDLTMDLVRHEVRRGGRLIPLTVKEYALLEYFLRHPNQVLSRAQILDNVWGYDAETAASVIDIYVHYLRNKIDRGERQPMLFTVRGVGYSLRSGEPA